MQYSARDRVVGEEQLRVVALGSRKQCRASCRSDRAHICRNLFQSTLKLPRTICARCLFERDVDLPRIVVGEAGLVEVATHPQADCVVSATVGAVGFVPTLRALEAGKRVALANKETLVMAGELMTRAAQRSQARSCCRSIPNTTRCISVCEASDAKKCAGSF